MDDVKIDFSRFEELINGEDDPRDKAEEAFLLAYTGGITGEMMANVALTIQDNFDDFGKRELLYFQFGYMMGQKDHVDNIDEFEEAKMKGQIQ